ncbi:MAG: hypothetical protein ACRDO1_12480 [Nocardioidaceae bacterium]
MTESTPEPQPTDSFGDARIDDAVARTDGLDERPVSEHVEVYDDVHQRFREALSDADRDTAG